MYLHEDNEDDLKAKKKHNQRMVQEGEIRFHKAHLMYSETEEKRFKKASE